MSDYTIEARLDAPSAGQLSWQPTVSERMPGIEAPWCRGKFKILTVTRSLSGLFFESNDTCRFLRLGSIEHLKYMALTHKCEFRSRKDIPQ